MIGELEVEADEEPSPPSLARVQPMDRTKVGEVLVVRTNYKRMDRPF